MDRRASTIEQNDNQEQHSAFEQTKATVPLHDYNAAAAALSRLSVVNETAARQLHASTQATGVYDTTNAGVSGSVRAASPLPTGESTYETATCPSPSKRSSDFFDQVLEQDQHLKRLRRDSARAQQQQAQEREQPVRMGSSTQLHRLPAMVFPNAFARAPLKHLASTRLDGHALANGVGNTKRSIAMRVRSLSEPLLPSVLHRGHASRHVRASVEPPARPAKRSRDKASHQPPISQQTLRELELNEIFKNAQLRHDIVHDPNLQFRPNTDGERGAKKRQDADRYWRAVAKELDAFDRLPMERLRKTRTAMLLREIRNILLSLVPQEEKEQVASMFDTELVTQTLAHGLFDAPAFAHRLSTIMKKHCAPMRDEAVDNIVARLAQADTSVAFADALRATFDVLEVMKLDVANHQLRTLRGYLLDSAVEFERSWFRRRFQADAGKQARAAQWFASVHTDATADPRLSFAEGFVAMTQTAIVKGEAVPTFHFDHGRLQALGNDASESVDLMVVVLLAKQMLKLQEPDLSALKQDFWTLVASDRAPPQGLSRWQVAIPSLAMHLARLAEHCTGLTLPTRETLTFAERWLERQLAADSPVRVMLTSRLASLLTQGVHHALVAEQHNGFKTRPALSLGAWQDCALEVDGLAARMAAVATFHWRVHGQLYLALLEEDAVQQLAL